jgi:hypothetical protein
MRTAATGSRAPSATVLETLDANTVEPHFLVEELVLASDDDSYDNDDDDNDNDDEEEDNDNHNNNNNNTTNNNTRRNALPNIPPRSLVGRKSLSRKSLMMGGGTSSGSGTANATARRRRRRSSARFLKLSSAAFDKNNNNDDDNDGPDDTAADTQSNLGELYKKAIRMNAENRINASNSWNLRLIENIDQFLMDDNDDDNGNNSNNTSAKTNTKTNANANGTSLHKSSKNANSLNNKSNNSTTADNHVVPGRVNFTKASCTLDASVKIYSYRVDDVHLTSYKVLANLNRTHSEPCQKKKDNIGNDNAQQPTESRIRSKNASTLETHIGTYRIYIYMKRGVHSKQLLSVTLSHTQTLLFCFYFHTQHDSQH